MSMPIVLLNGCEDNPGDQALECPVTRKGSSLKPLILIAALTCFATPGIAVAQSGVEVRLNELQRSLTALSAQIEQLKTQNQQLQQRFDKMQTSLGQRIERLEKPPAPKPTPRSGSSKH